jgi:hypothetical protein
MSELVPARSFITSRARNVSRELTKLDNRGRYELARINQEADLQAERVSAIGYVTHRAMIEVALLSQLENQLSELVPSATPRLQGLSDLGALSMAEVLTTTVRRVK